MEREVKQSEPPVKRTNFYSEYRVVRTIASTDGGKTKIVICTRKNSADKTKVCAKSKIRSIGPLANIIPDDRELDVLRLMCHKNIVRLIGGYLNTRKIHIVMELCGGELGDFVMYKRALELVEVQRIGHMLLDALVTIHDLNVIHNDVKPSNLLFSATPPPPEGDIKLIDFGLSVPLEIEGSTCSLNAGTFDFNPPEKVNRPRNYGVGADCWAAGIVLFFCVYKINPFQSYSDDDTKARINRGFYSLYPHFVEDTSIPEDFRDLVVGLLHPDPRERLTAFEAREHLFFSLDLSESKSADVSAKSESERRQSFSLSSRSSVSSTGACGFVYSPTVADADVPLPRRRSSITMSLASKTVEDIKEREGDLSLGNRSRRGSKGLVHKEIGQWLHSIGAPPNQVECFLEAFSDLGIMSLHEVGEFIADVHCLDGSSHTWRDMMITHLRKFRVESKWISAVECESSKLPQLDEQNERRRHSRSESLRFIADFEKELQDQDEPVELSHKLKKLQEKYAALELVDTDAVLEVKDSPEEVSKPINEVKRRGHKEKTGLIDD